MRAKNGANENYKFLAWGGQWFVLHQMEFKKSLAVTGAITKPLLGVEYQLMVIVVTYH